jgi:hypothetical protein
MRKGLLLLILALPLAVIHAQLKDPDRDFMAGLYVKGGWNLPVRLTTKYITEETSPWHGYQSWSAGGDVSWMVSEFYRIEIALCWSWHKIGFELSPPIYDKRKIYTESFSLISIPVTLKRYLYNNFFISAGTIVDFSYKGKPEWVDPQSGFGLTLGAGWEFRIKDFAIDLSPVAELHSVVPFASEDNQQRLFVGAIRIGISYNRNSAGNSKDDENKLKVITAPGL